MSVLPSPAQHEPVSPAPASSTRTKRPARRTGAFTSPAARRRWWILFGVVCTVAILACIGLIAWKNPAQFGTPVFWRLARRRAFAVLAIAIVAVCQGMATVAFQTVANNRIITPSCIEQSTPPRSSSWASPASTRRRQSATSSGSSPS